MWGKGTDGRMGWGGQTRIREGGKPRVGARRDLRGGAEGLDHPGSCRLLRG